MSALLLATLVALAVATALSLRAPRPATVLAAAAGVALAVVGISAALGAGAHADLGTWLGFGPSALRADGLAGIFLALTGVTGAAVAIAYAEAPARPLVVALHPALVFCVAVAITASNGFLFLLAWESLGVCIYLLASSDRDRPGALLAGYLTAGLTKIGGAALLTAVALLYGRTGSFSLIAWEHAATGLPAGVRTVLFILFLVGFATKIGILPLQGAVPAGYGSAPRAGAASLSVALAAGFYGLWRFVFGILGPEAPAWWGETVLVIGAVTAIAGITYAITQDELRRFLGFSTIEHTGITLLGFGVALLGQTAHQPRLAAAGLLAATLHLVAHGLAKTLALLDVDRIGRATGERTLSPLGGLGTRMRPTSLTLTAASLTLAAIPPLGGFVSEWFTFEALLQAFRLPTLSAQLLCALAAAALALTAGVGLLAFAKFLGFTIGGPSRSATTTDHEPVRSAVSVISLGAVVAALGALAPWEIHLLGHGLAGPLGFDPADATISHPLVLGPVFADFSVLAPTWLVIVLPAYALLAALWAARRRTYRVRRAPVWVTGSAAPLDAVQYRPSAYSNPLRVVLRGPLGYRSVVTRDGDRLEQRAHVVLAVERFLYAPAQRLALAAAARMRRLQSGRLGPYLLYMLAVLIVVLAVVPFLN